MSHDRRVRHPVEPGRSSPHSRQSLDRWQLTPQHRARSSWAVSEGSGTIAPQANLWWSEVVCFSERGTAQVLGVIGSIFRRASRRTWRATVELQVSELPGCPLCGLRSYPLNLSG